MRKRLIRTFAVLLAVLLLFLAPPCLSMLSSPAEVINFETVNNGNNDTITAYPAYDSPEAFAAEMELATENGGYQLYYHPRLAAVGLYRKADRAWFFSNPYDVDNGTSDEETVKNGQRSQVLLNYYSTADDKSAQLNSFSDSIAKNQYTIEAAENGVAVRMTLGQAGDSFLLPDQISQKTLESYLAKLDSSDAEMIRAVYQVITLEGATEELKESLLQKYPYLQTGNLCELYAVSVREKRQYSALLEEAGFNDEAKKREYKAIGYSQKNTEPAFTLTVRYALEDDGLCASVDLDEVGYDPSLFQIDTITLLPYFGCGLRDDTAGELLIPDGCGAVVRYNNGGSKRLGSLTMPVYGEDAAAVSGHTAFTTSQQIRLPVFGNTSARGAYLAVIEEGESVCTITVDGGDGSNHYARAYATAKYRYNTQYYYNDKDFSKYVVAYADEHNSGNIRVKYLPLGNGADYADMAAAYRGYLTEKGVLQLGKMEPRLVLQVLGVGKDKDGSFPLTTFRDAAAIAEELQKEGIDKLALRFLGGMAGGLSNRYASKASFASEMGGAGDWRTLKKTATDTGTALYMDMDLAYVRETGLFDGFSVNQDACRNLRNQLTGLYAYNYGDSAVDTSRLVYGVSASKLRQDVEKLAKSVQGKLEGAGLSAGSLGTALNATFKKGGITTRPQAQELQAQSLQVLAQNGKLMLEGPNAYTLPYCASAVNIAVSSSGYASIDYDVPFLQMVLSGCVEYAPSPINESENVEENLLKAIETGSSLSFIAAYRNQNRLKGSPESSYYSVDYATLKGEMVNFYKAFSAAADRVKGAVIADHERLADQVYRTTWSNGESVIVNYSSTPYTAGSVTVESKSYQFDVKQGEGARP